MAYTLKERFANKSVIEKMSLFDILKKFGYKDLLKNEINKRLSTNIDEVRDFYKECNPEHLGGFGDYSEALTNLSNKLKLSPIEILCWKSVYPIPDAVAYNFLVNEYSWLENTDIVNKVSQKFLFNILLTNDNLYQYSSLLEKIDSTHLHQLLCSPNTIYNKLPNLDILLEKANLNELDIKRIIQSLIEQKNYSTIINLIKLNKLSKASIEELIINIKNNLTLTEYLNFLNSLPKSIIDYINQDEYFLKQIFETYTDKTVIILNSPFIIKLNDQTIINLFSNIEIYSSMLKNNALYEKLKSKIDYNLFIDYFFANFDNTIKHIKTSNFLQEFVKNGDNVFYKNNGNELVLKYYNYLLDNPNLLEFCIKQNLFFKKADLKFFLGLNNINLSEQQQINLATFFEYLDYNLEGTLSVFGKYPILAEICIKNGSLNNIIKREYNQNENVVIKFLNQHSDKVDIIDTNIFFKKHSPDAIMKLFDLYPNFAEKMMERQDFIDKLLENEETILSFMPILNKYHITNPTIISMNESFNKIRTVRPELSWGNSSLNPTILKNDFIEIFGVDYINAVLQFDSQASDIITNLYKQNKLSNLKIWLDYLTKNISSNFRMIHFYILAYEKTENLAFDLLSSNAILDDYQKQILEEIIEQNNQYDIKSLEELNHYFEIKALRFLNNNTSLSYADVQELFLNTSALDQGMPWKQKFDLVAENLDYFKYKYVNTGIISQEEYVYLVKVKNILSTGNDIGLVQSLIEESLNERVPTARNILERINKATIEELNSHLLDLKDLRNIASYTNPESQVYIETKDGIEIIHLNGYDYKALSCSITPRVSIQKSTFSHAIHGFEEYRIFSEQIKEDINYENLSNLSIGDEIINKPKTWELIEGISTISTGISSSRHGYSGLRYSWGRQSNLNILGYHPNDAGVSHEIRDLTPAAQVDLSINLKCKSVLYGDSRGEIFFDRFNENNERINPEFIISNGIISTEEIETARYFNCPIVVRNSRFYPKKEYEIKLDLQARKKFLETFNMNLVDNIIYNYQNQDNNEKISFLLNSLFQALNDKRIDLQTYLSKLIELKWKLYEIGYVSYTPKIDEILATHNEMQFSEETNMKRGNINFIFLIVSLTIFIGIIVGIILIKVF